MSLFVFTGSVQLRYTIYFFGEGRTFPQKGLPRKTRCITKSAMKAVFLFISIDRVGDYWTESSAYLERMPDASLESTVPSLLKSPMRFILCSVTSFISPSTELSA